MKRFGAVAGFTYLITQIILNIFFSIELTIAFAATAFISFIIFLSLIKLKYAAFIIIRYISLFALIASIIFGANLMFVYNKNADYYQKEIELKGEIYTQSREIDYGKYETEIVPITPKINGRIKVYSDINFDAELYDVVTLNIKAKQLSGIEIFNYATDARADGVFLTGNYIKDTYKLVSKNNSFHFRTYIVKSRKYVSDALQKYMGKSGALANTLISGDKINLEEKDLYIFRVTGVYHVMATSGYHLTLIVSLLFYFLLALGVSKKSRVITAIIFCFAFSAFVGFTPSITRALIMNIIVLFTFLFDADFESINSLGASALIICIFNPFAALDVGLLLSFLATLGLLMISYDYSIFSEKATLNIKKIFNKTKGFLINNVTIAIYASIFTMPLCIYLFDFLPTYTLLGNLLASAITPIIIIISSLVLLFSNVPVIAYIIGIVNMVICKIFMKILEFISQLPFSTIYANIWFFYIVSILLIVFLLFKKFNTANIKITSAVAISIAIVFCFVAYISRPIFNTNIASVEFVDVGFGDGAIISDGSNSVVIDGGYENRSSRVTDKILKSNTKLTSLLISHFHTDHAGAAPKIIEKNRPKRVVTPLNGETINIYNTIVATCASYSTELVKASKNIDINEIKDTNIKYLVEHIDYTDENLNYKSAIIKVNNEKSSFLFMGDYNKNPPKIIEMYNNMLKADVIKVAHHGSFNSVDKKLFDIVAPKYAIISVGKNSFSLPKDDTLLKLYDYKISTYRTDYNGDVLFKMGDKIEIKTSR